VCGVLFPHRKGTDTMRYRLLALLLASASPLSTGPATASSPRSTGWRSGARTTGRRHPSTNCNAASCGSVDTPTTFSKYETTNAQYAEFLNAADAGGSNTLASHGACSARDFEPFPNELEVVSGFAFVERRACWLRRVRRISRTPHYCAFVVSYFEMV